MREELSTIISNRSASYFENEDYISALADAELVISIRKPWSKGHFRKAKALLGLERLGEAADAVRLGLSFEPGNAVRTPPTCSLRLPPHHFLFQELSAFLAEIERVDKKRQEVKLEARSKEQLQ